MGGHEMMMEGVYIRDCATGGDENGLLGAVSGSKIQRTIGKIEVETNVRLISTLGGELQEFLHRDAPEEKPLRQITVKAPIGFSGESDQCGIVDFDTTTLGVFEIGHTAVRTVMHAGNTLGRSKRGQMLRIIPPNVNFGE